MVDATAISCTNYRAGKVTPCMSGKLRLVKEFTWRIVPRLLISFLYIVKGTEPENKDYCKTYITVKGEKDKI